MPTWVVNKTTRHRSEGCMNDNNRFSQFKKELQKALISAFPTKADLKQLVDFKLGENLETIAGGVNLTEVVYSLIEWANAQGRLDDLVNSARSQNPGNTELKSFAEKFGSWLSQTDQKFSNFSPTSQETTEQQLSKHHHQKIYPQEERFIEFTNRETEKEVIKNYLKGNYYVQVQAHAGLGKTYLLQEIARELETQEYQKIWIDFANEHKNCCFDTTLFFNEFATQAVGQKIPPIISTKDELMFQHVGPLLANLGKVVLFLDNIDRCDGKVLRWMRYKFFEEIVFYNPTLHVVTSSQKEVPELQGYNKGRSFRSVFLHRFTESDTIYQVINQVVSHSGSRQTREKQLYNKESWQQDLDVMVKGIRYITRGHPLAIERVLRYTAEHNGFTNPHFFTNHQQEICKRCLAPMLHERVLSTIDDSSKVRSAFWGLCVFRLIWPFFLKSLTQSEIWEPFSTTKRDWKEFWWASLQDTHLIENKADLFELSPVIRQLIAMVLQAENESLYQEQNQQACNEYTKLLESSFLSSAQRAIYIVEILYHTTQSGSITPNTSERFLDLLRKHLNNVMESSFGFETLIFLQDRLRHDIELREIFENQAMLNTYENLFTTIEDYINRMKEV